MAEKIEYSHCVAELSKKNVKELYEVINNAMRTLPLRPIDIYIRSNEEENFTMRGIYETNGGVVLITLRAHKKVTNYNSKQNQACIDFLGFNGFPLQYKEIKKSLERIFEDNSFSGKKVTVF